MSAAALLMRMSTFRYAMLQHLLRLLRAARLARDPQHLGQPRNPGHSKVTDQTHDVRFPNLCPLPYWLPPLRLGAYYASLDDMFAAEGFQRCKIAHLVNRNWLQSLT